MPDWKQEARRRLAGLGLPPVRVEEIAEELGQHLDERHRELLAAGATEEEARAAALRELSSETGLGDDLRRLEPSPLGQAPLGQPAGGRFLSGLGEDLRYGLRALVKGKGTTAAALLTLALGIGANTVIFSVVDAVLLRPLPFADPDRLVRVWGRVLEMGIGELNYPDAVFAYFQSRSRTLSPLAAYAGNTFTLAGTGEAERLNGAAVTADFFNLLGRPPQEGRGFLPEDERPGGPEVAVLSHGLWMRRFGGDPAILGQPLVLDGKPATVVGVMPPGFEFPPFAGATEVWVPLRIDPTSTDCWCYNLIGRLAPGRSPDDAAREIAVLSDDFWRDREGKPRVDLASGEKPKATVFALPLARRLVSEVRTPLMVLVAAVAMVLLIACANVANLLLARAAARRREIALRSCLGASPRRIVRQLLVESLLLALAGAGLGLLFALVGLRAVAPLVEDRVLHVQEIGLDLRALAFTAILGVFTGVAFGLVPALRGARADLHEAVREGAHGSRGARSRRLSHVFVVAQFALSLVLLVGGGLLLRSFRNLLGVDLGFQAGNVLVGRVSLAPGGPDEGARAKAFFHELAARIRALPGVRGAGLVSFAPFSEGDQAQVTVARGQEPAPGEPSLVSRVRVATPSFFAATGIARIHGRTLEDTDTGEAPRVAVVDETLARQFWPSGDAVGREIRIGAAHRPEWLTVVGVVRSVKHADVTEEPKRTIYVPFAQRPRSSMDVVVRAHADPAALTGALRREVRALDATVPFYEVHTLDGVVARSLATRRLTERLLLGFAATALLLAAIGVYGVMAQNVGQRTNEFGIRLALGAEPAAVLRMVMGEGLRLAGLGLLLGLGGAIALTRLVSSLLFGVTPRDPLTFAGTALVLGLVALGACYLPARRATRTDPLAALRQD